MPQYSFPSIYTPPRLACLAMSSLLEHIEQLARRLPFDLDDSESVNDAYHRWFVSRSRKDNHILEIWTYCYVYRYFTWKYIQNAAGSVADFEHLISRTYRKIMQHRERLDERARYASWVSVICKRTFLNFARARNDVVYLDQQTQELLVSEARPRARDRILMRQEIVAAVKRLPEYLQEAARLRFIRHMEYSEMEELMGKPVPTLRAYCHKALQKLREDESLRVFFEKWDDDFSS